MASNGREKGNKHDRDFQELRVQGSRRRRAGTLRAILFIFFLIVLVGFVIFAVNSYQPSPNALHDAKAALAASNLPWTNNFLAQYEGFLDWLTRRGTDTEVEFYDKISQVLIRSALSAGTPDPETGNVSLISTIFLSLHFSVLRLTFLFLSCWRLWIMAVLCAFAYAIHQYRAWHGNDILGQLGNGRLFYSGVRGSLDKIASNGAPDTQVTGLACISAAPLEEARKSNLVKILERYKATNNTNLELVARFLAYPNYPAYIAQSDEEVLLANFFPGASLIENTEILLEQTLLLHKAYTEGKKSEEFLPKGDDLKNISGKVTLEQHRRLITLALHRVVTPAMRTEISKIAAPELATIILGLESGKIMAYSFEGGKWIKKSQYPHLCARSVLHAVVPYGTEYNYFSRQNIRQAIIFGSRMSAFAPVRFPVDMGGKTEAARQWVEVLMATPHEVETVSDEVEMVGIVREAHVRWGQLIIDSVMSHDRKLVDGSLVTPVNQLVFFPATEIIKLLNKTIDLPTIGRLGELNELVSQRQRLYTMSLDDSDPPTFERIFPPLAANEMKKLADMHELSQDELEGWSALRLILNSFGWLARRVGDYSVPESSIIFAVFKVEYGTPGANDLNLIGRSAMIPFRGSRFEAKWGKAWVNRFGQASTVTMSEAPDDYQKLMRGIDESKLRNDDFSLTNFALG